MKRKKLWLILAGIILALFLGISAFAGNYLVDYALAVDENGRIGAMGDAEYTGKQDTLAQQEYDVWINTIKTEEWTIENEGLKLWGLYYPGAPESHRYVLAVHGYTVDNRDIAPAIKPIAEQGYHVVTPDQRGRGKSEGSYLGMGWLEKEDVIAWTEEILRKDPEAEIILYGESMGAATVMQAAGETLDSKVVGVIEDCGYTSAYDMFADQLKERFGLPEFPFLPAADIMGQLRAGYNFTKASPLKQLKKASLPILFIHGESDDYVPTWMGQKLYDSYQGEKELLLIPGAGHGASADVDPETYYETVFRFLNQHYTVQ